MIFNVIFRPLHFKDNICPLPETPVWDGEQGRNRHLLDPKQDAQLPQPDPHHPRHVHRDFGGKPEVVLPGHVVVVDVNTAPTRQQEGVGGWFVREV